MWCAARWARFNDRRGESLRITSRIKTKSTTPSAGAANVTGLLRRNEKRSRGAPGKLGPAQLIQHHHASEHTEYPGSVLNSKHFAFIHLYSKMLKEHTEIPVPRSHSSLVPCPLLFLQLEVEGPHNRVRVVNGERADVRHGLDLLGAARRQ